MKTLIVLTALIGLGVGFSAEACNAYQKKQCQANPQQCEAAGICQGYMEEQDDGEGYVPGPRADSSEFAEPANEDTA